MRSIRFFALLLCLLLLLQTAPLRTAAAPAETEQRYNIMIVTDCSGSLLNGIRSDPQGHRYDAMAMFLDLLTESGNNVGAIVFNSTTSTTDTSEDTMREGLQVDTGLLVINSDTDRENLMQKIRSITPGGYTDIGTALLAAAEYLKGMEAKNGLESIIILFTDGATETKDKYLHLAEQPVYAQSLKNRDAAVDLIKQEGITLCGVYLRTEQIDLENNEVLQLVREANGFDSSASVNKVGDLFIHVQEAYSLADAFERFFTLVSGTGTKPFEGETGFRIPGEGIEEVNISVTVQGDTLEQCRGYIDQLQVTLIRPDNTEYSSRELGAIASLGNSYAVYKLQGSDLESGPWSVKVQCPGATLRSSIFINPNVSAEVSFSADPSTLPLRTPISANARLTHSGTPLANADDYQEYTCTLYVQDDTDPDKEWPVEMFYDSAANAFVCQLQLESYSNYNVYAEFKCGESIKLRTPYTYWSIRNEAPVAVSSYPVPITHGLFSSGTAEVNLYDLVSDKEDKDEELDIRFDCGKYAEEALSRNDGMLTIDGVIGETGDVNVIFTDTAGAETITQLNIVYTNNMARDLAIIFVSIAVLVVTIGFLWSKKKYRDRVGGKLPGQLVIKLPITQYTLVPLSVLAQNCVHRNLYDILTENREDLDSNALDYRCTKDELDQFLHINRKLLSDIRISVTQLPKTSRTACRLTGLPGSESQIDLTTESPTVDIRLTDSTSVHLEYSRFE